MKNVTKKFSIVSLVNQSGCFDLQFRKDTRHKRLNAPTYYRWKTQFVIALPKKDAKTLQRVKREMGCGKINIAKNQARFSVQSVGEIHESVVPFFKKNKLAEKKKKDFELWQRAVSIISRNRGKYISKWEKNDLMQLIEIQKAGSKYKNNPRKLKWAEIAKSISRKSH